MIQVWKSYSIPSATFIRNKLTSVAHIQGEGNYTLFKERVSNNLRTHLKLPFLVDVGPQSNLALLSGKFY